ncbi:hypothetical protein [Nonomuraea sp. NPDC052265]|uniref:hypothetical protein n=1 Tax=Nonomuraea sp. NPDC052265 TaxID=3364374 RepID=UPI0037C681A1
MPTRDGASAGATARRRPAWAASCCCSSVEEAGGRRDGLGRSAHSLRAVILRHPWMASVLDGLEARLASSAG